MSQKLLVRYRFDRMVRKECQVLSSRFSTICRPAVDFWAYARCTYGSQYFLSSHNAINSFKNNIQHQVSRIRTRDLSELADSKKDIGKLSLLTDFRPWRTLAMLSNGLYHRQGRNSINGLHELSTDTNYGSLVTNQQGISPNNESLRPRNDSTIGSDVFYLASQEAPSTWKCAVSYMCCFCSALVDGDSGSKHLSIFHWTITVTFGIVLLLGREASNDKVPLSVFEVFQAIYMCLAVIWMSCVTYCCQGRCCIPKHPKSRIPGYLIFGVTFFLVGSSFLTLCKIVGILLGLSCEKETQSYKASHALYHFSKFVFLNFQLYFFCRFSNKSFFNRWGSSFFLMHIIGVNMCSWFYVIIEESAEDMKPTKPPNTYSQSCNATMAMENLIKKANYFLYPFEIEYSVMSSGLLFNLWYSLKQPPDYNSVESSDANSETNGNGIFSSKFCGLSAACSTCCKCKPESSPQGHARTVAFWKNAICGFSIGIITLVGLLVLIICVYAEKDVARINPWNAYYGVRILIYIMMAFASLVGINCLVHFHPSSSSSHTIVDTVLLMIGISGAFILTGFQIVVGFTELKSKRDKTYVTFFLLDAVAATVQFTVQTLFVIRALLRSAESYDNEVYRDVSIRTLSWFIRQIAALLSIVNFALWAMNTFEINFKEMNNPEISVIDSTVWSVVRHIAYPLCIFFRLHSVFCCFEIVINRFGIDAIADSRLRNI
ncbi:predicted protein [Nematostella vectensis]|uniref:Otopetrin n=1 Tax=Nematostella vectensis TaxID=45351 RepID=A7SAV2_NEMVE|nr:predicted protein [Nematostella vectensis]|eukprot:XP_001631207.1 predicted protein [Nematostella vectensis]